jgi:hypothetical protein
LGKDKEEEERKREELKADSQEKDRENEVNFHKLKGTEDALKELRDVHFSTEKQLKDVNDAFKQKRMEIGRLQSTFKDLKVRYA